MIPRDRVDAMPILATLTLEEHTELCQNGLNNGKGAWSPAKDHPTHLLVKQFKSEVKSYYFWRQNHRCCYCSSPLQAHGKTYDAEHIMDKSTYPQFTFDLRNLSAACVICNSHKLNKPVLTEAATVHVADISRNKNDYKIVHPHLDEWSDYLTFDVDGLVRPLHNYGKGPETISVCGIETINFLRLSSKFSGDVRQSAYDLMCAIIKLKRKSRIRALVDILEKLAANSPEAQAVAKGMRELMKIDAP